MIKSEDFLLGYVLFDKQPDFAEWMLSNRRGLSEDEGSEWGIGIPAGVVLYLAGSHENQCVLRRNCGWCCPRIIFNFHDYLF